jgi:hypothetical protein
MPARRVLSIFPAQEEVSIPGDHHNRATLLLDQYSEDWMRNVGVMVTGTADVVRQGPEFEKGKALLETKFQQYASLFPIKQGESVVICFKPAKKVGWDYIAGELREPH